MLKLRPHRIKRVWSVAEPRAPPNAEPSRLIPTYLWISLLSAATGLYTSSRAREPFRALMGGVVLIGLTLLPATSAAALEIRGMGLGSYFFPDLPGVERYLGVAIPTLALLAYAFVSFQPEPWLSERIEGRTLRVVIVGALLLSVAFW